MPPYEPRQCPKCHQTNSFDMAKVKQVLPIFRSVTKDEEKREYPVKCKHCGHEFVIKVQP
ncbi:MAG: hypothetical protein ABIG63_17775 [Chloroflexota bacterium]